MWQWITNMTAKTTAMKKTDRFGFIRILNFVHQKTLSKTEIQGSPPQHIY